MSIDSGERLLNRLTVEHGADEAWRMVDNAGGQLERWNACGLAAMPLAVDECACIADNLATVPALGHMLADAKAAHDRQTGGCQTGGRLRGNFRDDLGTAVLANLSLLARQHPGAPMGNIEMDFTLAIRRTTKRRAAIQTPGHGPLQGH